MTNCRIGASPRSRKRWRNCVCRWPPKSRLMRAARCQRGIADAPRNEMKEHRRRKTASVIIYESHIESAGRPPQIIGEGYSHGGFSKSLDVVGGLRHAGPGGASAAGVFPAGAFVLPPA